MPKVSVIIPTYNRADLIAETIDSVLKQTYQDFEIIVVDHGSTDNTAAMFQGNPYGDRVRYERISFCDMPACPRNQGIAMAKGVYIAFVDSDDLWVPEKLSWQVSALEEDHRLGWSYGNAERFGSAVVPGTHEIGFWQFHEGNVFENLLIENFIATGTVMVRKECFDRVGMFDLSPALRSAEDYEMWIRLAARYKVHAVRRVVAKIRVSDRQMTADMTKGFEPQLAVFESIQKKIGIESRLYKKSLAGLHLRHFRYAVMAGSSKAVFHLKESFKNNPWSTRLLLYRIFFTLGGLSAVSRLVAWEKMVKKRVSE